MLRRGSFGGRKTSGVWYGVGAEEGGLKTMWSLRSEGGIEDVKEGSGLVRSRLVVRRAEDSCRRDVCDNRAKIEERMKDVCSRGCLGRKMDMS